MSAFRGGHPGRLPGGLLAMGLVTVLLAPVQVFGQALELEERPSASSLLCDPATDTPMCGLADEAEVERLINEATQATILGDLTRADQLLSEALELDPCAVEAAYLQGRTVAETDGPEAATEWFCRYLALAPAGASATEAHRRLDQAVESGAAAELLDEFTAAVASYRGGNLQRAVGQFTAVVDRHPVAEAYYNRALVRIALDRPAEARTDLARYLELRPEGERSERIARALEGPADWSPRSPTAAFFLGIVLPGAGQYYTGRTGFGLVMTTLAAGAVAGGLFYERTTLLCRNPAPSGDCPETAIAGRETERPLLIPALGVAGGLMLLSAIEAAIHAGGREPPLSIALGGAGSIRLEVATRPILFDGVPGIQIIRLLH